MPPRRLLIGTSPRLLRNVPAELGFRGKTLQFLEQSVAHWIMSLGAVATMLPTLEHGGPLRRSEVCVRDIAELLDGVVLQGGADLDPRLYGEEPIHTQGPFDAIRDRFELDLIDAFTSLGKPVLGICRGMQLINVALGGSLHQDLCANGATAFRHVDADAYDRHVHEVQIDAGSHLAQWYGFSGAAKVTSIHHQGVARLGHGLILEAHSHDGVIEAFRHEGDAFLYGVQWHPEFQDGSVPEVLPADPLMRAFLQAAQRRRDAVMAVAAPSHPSDCAASHFAISRP